MRAARFVRSSPRLRTSFRRHSPTANYACALRGRRLRRPIVKKATHVLITTLIAVLAIPAMSQNLLVGTCKAPVRVLATYTTIQTAVNHAFSGATILVCPGTYAEQITITTPLTLKGISAPPDNAPTIVEPAGGLNVGTIQPLNENAAVPAMIDRKS